MRTSARLREFENVSAVRAFIVTLFRPGELKYLYFLQRRAGSHWDIYALLRRQYKPVEMVVIPGGTHGLLTPSERMISLQGNVDWYRFWLKGEERSTPFLWAESDETLKAQYARWRQMAELKRIEDAKPECARRTASR